MRHALAAAAAVALLLGPAEAGPIRDRVYQPDRGWAEPEAWSGTPPRPVSFGTADGLDLSSWFWPGRGDRLILFFHGNAGNQTHAAHYAEPLVVADGPSVMMGSYRGYGGNPGAPSQDGLMADARAALAAAEARGFPPDKVVLIGWSLGGAVALALAAERPVAGVITIGTFTRMTDMAPAIARPFITDKWDNLAAVARQRQPLVIVHGDRDEVVPFEMGRRLHAAASAPKTFVPVEGGGHRLPMDQVAPHLLKAAAALFEHASAVDSGEAPAKTP